MTNRNVFIFSWLLISSFPTYGQVAEFAIPNSDNKVKTSARLQANVLQLPYWDDFYGQAGAPSDSLWLDSYDVLINDFYGYLPPSGGVATFDGLTGDGLPFSNDPESSERNDRLTSNYIDLSSYSPADSIYLSFFYQFGGYGEAPNPEDGDKLIIEFLNSDSTWQQALIISPEGSLDPQLFYQILVPVKDTAYFHDSFQFSIQNFGNQSGPYDVWNIDYVYLNNDRTYNDIYFPDRTVTHGLSGIFDSYNAIPRAHLDFEEDFSIPYYSVRTLYNTFQIYYQEVAITVFQNDDTTTTFYPSTTQGTNTPLFVGEIDTVTLPFPITNDGFPEKDSTVHRIDYDIFVNSFDNNPGNTGDSAGNYTPQYHPIDFRENNKINHSYILDDYYAYDDGSAESSIGLQVAGNKLAYQYTLRNVDSTYIKAIDINTIYAGESAIGKSISLHIWSHVNGQPGVELYDEEAIITGDDSRTGFTRYELERSILVKDTFYIGFTLNTSGRFPVGLDKSKDNTKKIFENINGDWLPIGNRINGTLMMRPVIGPEPEGPITAIENEKVITLIIYPNPSDDGNFEIVGNFPEISIVNISGKEAQYEIQRDFDKTKLKINKSGIYILSVLVDGTLRHSKLIVK